MKFRKILALLIASILLLTGCSGKSSEQYIYDIAYTVPNDFWAYHKNMSSTFYHKGDTDTILLVTSAYYPDYLFSDDGSDDYIGIYDSLVFTALNGYKIVQTGVFEETYGCTGTFSASKNDHTSDTGINFKNSRAGIKRHDNLVTMVILLSEEDCQKDFYGIFESIGVRESFSDSYNQLDSGIAYKIPDDCTGENGKYLTKDGDEIVVKVFSDIEINQNQSDNYQYLLTDLYEKEFSKAWNDLRYDSAYTIMQSFQIRNRIGVHDNGYLENGRKYYSALIRVSESTFVLASICGEEDNESRSVNMAATLNTILESVHPESN